MRAKQHVLSLPKGVTSMKKRILTYILPLALLFALSLSGCRTTETGVLPKEIYGTILISLNPEIEIEYDREGLVTDVLGLNDDGKFISSEQDDLIGKPCKIALAMLIEDIFEAGYFSSDVGGPGRTIVLKLEKGSVYHKGFLDALEESVFETAAACGLQTITISIDEDDLLENGLIDEQTAEDLVLHHLQLPSANLIESALEGETYTMEFTSNDKTFQYEVDAVTGKVLQVIDAETGLISCACCSDPDCTCMVDGPEVCSNPYCKAAPAETE